MKTTNKITQIGFALGLAFALSACGGSSSSNSKKSPDSNDGSTVVESVGVLSDSVIEGANYRQEGGKEGVTDENGRFAYLVGQEVVFTVGELEVGRYTPKTETATVTPHELVEALDESERENVLNNLLVFFQSLDDDGDPSKGIRITKESSEKLKLSSLDFKKDPVVFASDLQSTGAIPEGRAPVELEQALAHYHAQLLIGSWLHEDVDYEEGEENSGKPFVPVLTFMPNNTYVLSVIDPNEEDQEDDEFCYSGFEVGSYTYSFDSLETVKIVRSKEAWLGSNTVCGMGDEDDTGDEQVHTLTAIDVNTMKLFRKDVKDYEETNVFNRVKNNGLKGTLVA